jgi:hypothetical protein
MLLCECIHAVFRYASVYPLYSVMRVYTRCVMLCECIHAVFCYASVYLLMHTRVVIFVTDRLRLLRIAVHQKQVKQIEGPLERA